MVVCVCVCVYVCVCVVGRDEMRWNHQTTTFKQNFLQIDIHLSIKFQAALFFSITKVESIYLQTLKVLLSHFSALEIMQTTGPPLSALTSLDGVTRTE